MSYVKAKFTVEIEAKFRFNDILAFVNATELTPVQFQAIADVLIANLEGHTERDDGTVEIGLHNFNENSFYDIQEELTEQYGDKESLEDLLNK